MNEMQAGARNGAQPDNIAGIGRDFRMVKHDLERGGRLPMRESSA